MSTTQSYPPQERNSNVMDPSLQHKGSKRKRDPSDHNGIRKQIPHWTQTAPMTVHNNGQNADTPNEYLASASNGISISQHIAQHLANASPTTAAAALAANMPQLTVPQPTELSFQNTGHNNDVEQQLDPSFDLGGGSDGDQHHHAAGGTYQLEAYHGAGPGDVQSGRDHESGGMKPAVGTDEWHKVRRDNHKEGP